ncbi:MAG: ADP-ribosylglycohydrolase family protein [Planctomycetaceae bacterium]|nr:ADP-ribosylglycohydrolase family protein [Planctomycetaceae bacterium]
MKKLVLMILFFVSAIPLSAQEYREIPVNVYRDKMKAGWIGQIAGVCWGAPTEFKFNGIIIPENKMPQWNPEMINNAFGQDDLYVEMTFLRSLEQYGLNVSQRQAGIDFANSSYQVWAANNAGRTNLRRGIAPPDSGHPAFNIHADDIDYQIEADYSGLIAPGLPQVAIELGEKFGGLMNYGDGLYAGQFVGGMYAEAFFESDIKKIIDAGLACIPQDSQYAEMVRDVLRWYDENPNDWTTCWQKINEKYQKNKDYRRLTYNTGDSNIDAKINGAYILVGLLYGKGDLDQTIILSTRCGQDSDCNPSNAGGVLFTTLGFSKLPPRFSEKLDETKKFSYTAYDFPALVDVCEKLARQAVLQYGGRIVKRNGEDVFSIPVQNSFSGQKKTVRRGLLGRRATTSATALSKQLKPQLKPYKPSWQPDPPQNVRFTEAELQLINFRDYELTEVVAKFFPGWRLTDCGPDMDPGFRAEYSGKKNVVMTHPKSRGEACVLTKNVTIPKNKKTTLKLVVAAHDAAKAEFDWELIVKADGKELLKQRIAGDWKEITVDLSGYAGKTVKLELLNQPNGWSYEAGYWHEISIQSK